MSKPIKKTSMAIGVVVVAILVVGGIAAALYWQSLSESYQGGDVRIYVPKDATAQSFRDSVEAKLGTELGSKVCQLWQLKDGTPERSHGSYVISPGMTAIDIAKKLLRGQQTPVRVTFNNARTMEQVADKVTASLEITPEEFLAACDTILPKHGFAQTAFPAAFLPDTYELYWTASPDKVVNKLLDARNKYWNDDRRAKAKSMGLKPVDIATIASIVEEETAKSDERPKVARLYLNRLDRGMMLQADPTVKYAVGDFALRRITSQHLQVNSPYNTYKHAGLPPGPIRVPERATLDAVLNAPAHPYIYMCAKEDFSGYHNFATDLPTHNANARRYHAALNARGIK